MFCTWRGMPACSGWQAPVSAVSLIAREQVSSPKPGPFVCFGTVLCGKVTYVRFVF